jgi:hypothetical protein
MGRGAAPLPAGTSVHARAYAGLLRLYPKPFRARYADEMVVLFGDQLRDARRSGGPFGTLRMWLRNLGDLAVTAASEHVQGERPVGHSLGPPPSKGSRALGLIGLLGGIALVIALVPNLPWTATLFNQRLVLYNVGAIAIIVAVHRRQASAAPLLSAAVVLPAILANVWYAAMIVIGIDRPQPPQADPDYRWIAFVAGVAMWLADAAFAFVAFRLAVVPRWAALGLAIGSVLAMVGMDRLELVRGELAWFFIPLALFGVALHGATWILLGADLAFRRSRPPAARVKPA